MSLYKHFKISIDRLFVELSPVKHIWLDAKCTFNSKKTIIILMSHSRAVCVYFKKHKPDLMQLYELKFRIFWIDPATKPMAMKALYIIFIMCGCILIL